MNAESLIDQYLATHLTEVGDDAEDTETAHQGKLMQFFRVNGIPDDSEIIKFADDLGITPHDLDKEVRKLLSTVLTIGKHWDTSDSQFNSVELAKGIEHELEHTDSRELAKAIAKDHLAEIPDYYSRLDDLEKDAQH